MFIAGTDVTAAIRRTQIDRMVPVVARHPPVREVMRERQRELGHDGDVVIEGRDIGTVVAPDAEVKVYLVADPAVRDAAPPRRAAGDRRRRTRDGSAPPRPERRGAHAPGAGRARDRHDEARRSTTSSTRSKSSFAQSANRRDGRPAPRCLLGRRARLHGRTGAPRRTRASLRPRAHARRGRRRARRRTTCTGSTSRSSARSRRGTSTSSRSSRRSASRVSGGSSPRTGRSRSGAASRIATP